MAKFQFRLEALARLRCSMRDKRRLHLAEALLERQWLTDRQKSLQAESETLKQTYHAAQGTLDVDRLMHTHRYQLVLRDQLRTLDQQAADLDDEIQRRQQALIFADREVRVLEKLRERQLASHLAKDRKIEASELDEIALRMAVVAR